MPGLEVPNLSSNWKILQQRLNAGSKQDAAAKGLKRKRDSEPDGKAKHRSSLNDVKRTKAGAKTSDRPQAKHRMGGATSKVWPAENKTASRKSSESARTDANATSLGKRTENGRPSSSASSTTTLVNQGLHPSHKPGKYLALDCEMVGTGPPPASDNVLARVSIVNYHGEQVYDSYVQSVPGTEVTDYRTFVSGIRPEHMRPNVARPFAEVQKEVAQLLDGKVLVGHALKNDLDVLLLSHPKRDIRDTARHAAFRKTSMGRAPALRKLAKELLGMEIQGGEHSSVEDARATMLLFRLEKDAFEKEVTLKFGSAIRREQKAKEEALRRAKAKAEQEESDLEDEDDEDEGEDADGTDKKASKAGKKKKKKKKRTKRA
ncbi:hypothetical protein MBLNU459_g1866t1 [Dothideomycetes sp. NU459]